MYESNDSGRATFDWDVGKHYLLFLISSATSDKSWSLDNCGNSGQLKLGSSVSAQIQKTGEADHKYGAISGIVGHAALSDPIPGVLVEASATNRHYSTTTNAQGSIQMNVLSGEYVVHATGGGLTFHTAEIRYSNPREVRIDSGGCVQVQFTASE